jgi:hypothetical protein
MITVLWNYSSSHARVNVFYYQVSVMTNWDATYLATKISSINSADLLPSNDIPNPRDNPGQSRNIQVARSQISESRASDVRSSNHWLWYISEFETHHSNKRSTPWWDMCYPRHNSIWRGLICWPNAIASSIVTDNGKYMLNFSRRKFKPCSYIILQLYKTKRNYLMKNLRYWWLCFISPRSELRRISVDCAQ